MGKQKTKKPPNCVYLFIDELADAADLVAAALSDCEHPEFKELKRDAEAIAAKCKKLSEWPGRGEHPQAVKET